MTGCGRRVALSVSALTLEATFGQTIALSVAPFS
jgi:hypothetical protein